jgi:hypothetical protein
MAVESSFWGTSAGGVADAAHVYWTNERTIPARFDLTRASPVIEAYKNGIDRTLLRENLRLTPAERVEKMIAALRFAEAVRDSRRTTTP